MTLCPHFLGSQVNTSTSNIYYNLRSSTSLKKNNYGELNSLSKQKTKVFSEGIATNRKAFKTSSESKNLSSTLSFSYSNNSSDNLPLPEFKMVKFSTTNKTHIFYKTDTVSELKASFNISTHKESGSSIKRFYSNSNEASYCPVKILRTKSTFKGKKQDQEELNWEQLSKRNKYNNAIESRQDRLVKVTQKRDTAASRAAYYKFRLDHKPNNQVRLEEKMAIEVAKHSEYSEEFDLIEEQLSKLRENLKSI